MALDPIKVNGTMYGWGSIVAKINGQQVNGFSEIGYSDSMERTPIYGSRGHQYVIIGWTRGKYITDPGKLIARKKTGALLLDYLGEQGGGVGISHVTFTLTTTFSEPQEGTQVEVCEGCFISKVIASHAEGTDGANTEFEIRYDKISRNGKYLFDTVG